MVKSFVMLHLALALLLTANTADRFCTANVPLRVKTGNDRNAIRVYQTPNEQGSLTVQSGNKATVRFYLFDLDGNLIYESYVQTHQPLTIQGLAAGTYTYHAFVADTRLKGGQVQVKN